MQQVNVKCRKRCIGTITTDLLNYSNCVFERLQIHGANQCNFGSN
jgi:hypothetical protein